MTKLLLITCTLTIKTIHNEVLILVFHRISTINRSKQMPFCYKIYDKIIINNATNPASI